MEEKNTQETSGIGKRSTMSDADIKDRMGANVILIDPEAEVILIDPDKDQRSINGVNGLIRDALIEMQAHRGSKKENPMEEKRSESFRDLVAQDEQNPLMSIILDLEDAFGRSSIEIEEKLKVDRYLAHIWVHQSDRKPTDLDLPVYTQRPDRAFANPHGIVAAAVLYRYIKDAKVAEIDKLTKDLLTTASAYYGPTGSAAVFSGKNGYDLSVSIGML